MIHFVYLIAFAILVAFAFALLTKGDANVKLKSGLKYFAQFVLISLALAWVFYFIPW